jgi:hypothetical protein
MLTQVQVSNIHTNTTPTPQPHTTNTTTHQDHQHHQHTNTTNTQLKPNQCFVVHRNLMAAYTVLSDLKKKKYDRHGPEEDK